MTQIEAKLIDYMGSDLSVVNAARVSFGKQSGWANEPEYLWGDDPILKEGDSKLIRYLAKHKHLSPFGHCFASFHVKAPIFVARQLVKHEYLRWNEISRRYVDDEPELYWPETLRNRSTDKKQGSDGINPLWNHGVGTGYYGELKEDTEDVLHNYTRMIEDGVAPEQARMILPANVFTEWYWSGSLDAFANMCKLRCASDTQYESRVVADQISEVMAGLYPVSWENLMESAGE